MAAAYSHGSVIGFLHEPAQDPLGALVLTHGAGLDCQSPMLAGMAEALCNTGLLVLRCNLRFRVKRKTGPPSPAGAADDREGLRKALDQLATHSTAPLLLGGHSYGGRQASLLMSQPDPPQVHALLLLSYPLHPPRKPEQLRSEHFARIRTPTFFFHGTRDSFGSPEEMEQALQLFPADTRTELLLADKTGHELAPKHPELAQRCAREFTRFTQLLLRPKGSSQP